MSPCRSGWRRSRWWSALFTWDYLRQRRRCSSTGSTDGSGGIAVSQPGSAGPGGTSKLRLSTQDQRPAAQGLRPLGRPAGGVRPHGHAGADQGAAAGRRARDPGGHRAGRGGRRVDDGTTHRRPPGDGGHGGRCRCRQRRGRRGRGGGRRQDGRLDRGRGRGQVGSCPGQAEQVPGDPYSPPCISFSGNNGGATSAGVSANTINVSYRITSDSESFQQTLASLGGANITDTTADIERTVTRWPPTSTTTSSSTAASSTSSSSTARAPSPTSCSAAASSRPTPTPSLRPRPNTPSPSSTA